MRNSWSFLRLRWITPNKLDRWPVFYFPGQKERANFLAEKEEGLVKRSTAATKGRQSPPENDFARRTYHIAA
jgi:hypothetical protein